MPKNDVALNLQEDFDALMAEAAEARLPVPQVPWNFVPAKKEDAEFIIAAVQQIRAGCVHRTAQVAEMNAVAERLADSLEARYRPALEAIVKTELAGGKAKSIKLVTGVTDKPTRAGFRTVTGGLRIVDKDAAVAWADEEFATDAETLAAFVKERVVRSPVAQPFKDHYGDTGEVPGGCEVVADEDKFYIK